MANPLEIHQEFVWGALDLEAHLGGLSRYSYRISSAIRSVVAPGILSENAPWSL